MKKFFEYTLATLLVMVAMALGQIPMTVNYQGTLRDAGGALINGNQNLTFRIYTAATGGSALVVAVNSSSGPVAGLTISNFTLSTEFVPAGGCLVDLIAVQTRSTGVYTLDLVPFRSNPNCRWLRGRYLISVLVITPQGRAVGVVELLVDL